MNTNTENKTKKSNIAIGLIIILLSFLLSTTAISMFLLYKDTIYKGVRIESMDVGGLAINEAQRKISTFFDKKNIEGNIEFIYGDKVWNLESSKIDLTYDYTNALDQAYKIGRVGSYYDRLFKIITLYKEPENIELNSIYNNEKLDSFIYDLEKEINQPAKDATIIRKDGKFHISDEVLGLKLNTNKVKQRLAEGISKIKNGKDVVVELSVETESPKITSEILSTINQLMGSYNTTFNASNTSRTKNISLAANTINGTVLMPGELFSFNEVVGPRTRDRGYKDAPVIFNGELVDGLGGGICQVSSTIYNAVLLSDINIVERVKHSIPSTYVPKGRDATVSYGVLDFKFENNRAKPIFIESYTKGNKMVINIYGYKNDNKVIQINSVQNEIVNRSIEVKYDANMLDGEEEIEEKGRDGYKVTTYKITLENGKEVAREKISYDYYRPKTKIIVKGTKKPPEKIKEPKKEEENIQEENEKTTENPRA